MSAGQEDPQPRIHRADVTAVTRVGKAMVRVTLGGPDMVDYPTTGVGDEWVRVFFPDAPGDAVRLPRLEGRGWVYEDDVKPSEMRTYTIRDWRPGEVDVDFVVHGTGVATTWATSVDVGGQAGLTEPVAVYRRAEDASHQFLFCDEPGLPAALRICEEAPEGLASTLVCEVRDSGFEIQPARGDVECIWLPGAGNGVSPSRLPDVLSGLDIPQGAAVWVGTESRVSRTLRRQLREEKGLARTAATTMGYWVHDKEGWIAAYDALGEDFADKVRTLYDSDRDPDEVADIVDGLYEKNGL